MTIMQVAPLFLALAVTVITVEDGSITRTNRVPIEPSDVPMVVSIPAGPVGKSLSAAAESLRFYFMFGLDTDPVVHIWTKPLNVRCAATPCTSAERTAIVDQLLEGTFVEYKWIQPDFLKVEFWQYCQPELSSDAPLPPCLDKPQRMSRGQ